MTKTDGNRQLQLGYNTTDNYGRIQVTQQGTGPRPLILQEAGGNVGVGTNSPQLTSPYGGSNGNIDANDVYLRSINRWASQVPIPFVDNLMVIDAVPGYSSTSTSYFDIPGTSKTVTLPAGTALIVWSMSCYSGGPSAGAVWYIRPVIGANAPPEGLLCATNEIGSHKSFSGSWAVVIPAGGTMTVKLQARCYGGFGDFRFDRDHLSWTIIVFRS